MSDEETRYRRRTSGSAAAPAAAATPAAAAAATPAAPAAAFPASATADGEPIAQPTAEPVAAYDDIADADEPNPSEAVLPKPQRFRMPGFRRRPKRAKEVEMLFYFEELRGTPGITKAAARANAQERLRAFAERPDRAAVEREFEATAPTSRTAVRTHVDPDVEIAAALRHPQVAWLIELLGRRLGCRGPKPDRSFVTAVFLHMAFALGRPDVRHAAGGLARGHTLRSWAFDYPGRAPQKSELYDSLRKILTGNPSAAATHVNLELFRQLAAQRNDKGQLRHPNAGRYLVADGSLIEANMSQKGMGGRSAGERGARLRLLAGPERRRVRYVEYRHAGNLVARVVGYKLMVISDLATTLPLMWKLVPATADERAVTLDLLREWSSPGLVDT